MPEDSSSYEIDESDRRSLFRACFNTSKSSWLSGNMDAHTTGLGLSYPDSAGDGSFFFVIVSHTVATPGFLIPVTM